jgi:hypothetical protein
VNYLDLREELSSVNRDVIATKEDMQHTTRAGSRLRLRRMSPFQSFLATPFQTPSSFTALGRLRDAGVMWITLPVEIAVLVVPGFSHSALRAAKHVGPCGGKCVAIGPQLECAPKENMREFPMLVLLATLSTQCRYVCSNKNDGVQVLFILYER